MVWGPQSEVVQQPQTIFLANAKSCIPFQVRRLTKAYNQSSEPSYYLILERCLRLAGPR